MCGGSTGLLECKRRLVTGDDTCVRSTPHLVQPMLAKEDGRTVLNERSRHALYVSAARGHFRG